MDLKVFFPQSIPWEFHSPMIGKFNAYNVVSALAATYLLGYNWKKASQGFRNFKGIPGRLQSVPNPKGILAYVDFAHTDEALRKVLKQLRETIKKSPQARLICVFGCGGDRDAGKRRFMGKIAQQLADLCVVTSDNPRTEHPRKIIDEIISDINMAEGRVFIEEDRKKAIVRSANLAQKGDVVVVCGKGHEKFQIVGDQELPFSDYDILKECLQEDD